eukprot:3156319-Prymnesium_polylepis.1
MRQKAHFRRGFPRHVGRPDIRPTSPSLWSTRVNKPQKTRCLRPVCAAAEMPATPEKDSTLKRVVAGLDPLFGMGYVASSVASVSKADEMVRPSAPFQREGWLRKRGKHNPAFKWRWCVIDGPTLLYYR